MYALHIIQYFIMSVCVNSFALFMYLTYLSQLIPSNILNKFESEYDFVIVGSGTAGSVIGHRISTETNYSFIIIEAGGRSNLLFEIPVLGPMLHESIYDWQYQTVPQKNSCLAMKDKKCRLPQGKIVGGSSKINNMVHVRGNISHYVNWFNGKYTEHDITKQFEFVENNIIHLSGLMHESELAKAVLEAAEELGYRQIQEFGKGFMRSKVSQKHGKRWSTSDNLDISKHILTNVLVETVNIVNNVANGVNVMLSNKLYTINARKGVILTAGTYNTPKILQLSGVGPSDLLKLHEIPVIKDLPVGKNLQDHVATGLDLILFNKSLSVNTMNMLNPFHIYDYFFNGKGPLTTPGCEVIGFLSTANTDVPDLQFMVMPVGISADRGTHLRKALGIQDHVWSEYFAKTYDKHTATILPIVLHPKSKGHVFIESRDPKQPPCIDPNFLSNVEDVKVLIDGIKLVVEFVKTSPMNELGAYINPKHIPGCDNIEIFTDIYWECYVRHLTLTSYHPVGTCSMGTSPSNRVVDTSFKVIGLENLFVADASVLPTLPSGNTNAAVAMMASLFFDINIKHNKIPKTKTCHKFDILRTYLHKVCIDEVMVIP